MQKRFWVPHNPLKRSSQVPLDIPDGFLLRIFGHASLPLHIDIGSDRGVFCLGMAEALPQVNFLGLEVRQKPLQEALRDPQTAQLPNCAFLHANANCHLRQILPHLAEVDVCTISINFPDPWTKKKHKKRRVLQPEFMPVLADTLSKGGNIVVQTDVLDLAADMRACARQSRMFRDLRDNENDWMAGECALFPVSTEWQTITSKKGLPIYRFIMQRL